MAENVASLTLAGRLTTILGRSVADLYREAHDRLPGWNLDVWAEIPRSDLEMEDREADADLMARYAAAIPVVSCGLPVAPEHGRA